MKFLILVSSLMLIQTSEAAQKDDQFCNEWAKYIDAFDMVSASKKELPYSMDKNNGDLVKGAMGFGESIIFVPEPSQALVKAWSNSTNSKLQATLKEQMDKYYEAKKEYNKKVSDLYKEQGDKQAIQYIKNGMFKQLENQIVALAKDVQDTATTDGDTIKTCFKAYQKLSHERVKDSNLKEYKYAGAISSLNADLQNCQMGSKITDTNRYNVKTVDEIVEQVIKKEGQSGIAK